jgi:hypothetical protein
MNNEAALQTEYVENDIGESPYREAPRSAHIYDAGSLTIDFREVVAVWAYDQKSSKDPGIIIIFRSGLERKFNGTSVTKDIPRAYKDYILGRR